MKKQFESGNLTKIKPGFPDNIKSINYFEPGYTFLNNGPYSCILETAIHICQKIEKIEFESAIVSVGAYSWLLANYIINILGKNVFVIGGGLPYFFGIKTNRTSGYEYTMEEYWISVPDELKPLNYEKKEQGTYW
jgi:hypothetical protein